MNAAEAETQSLVRCFQFWIYVFTYFFFVAVYTRPDTMACGEPPASAATIECNIDPTMNATRQAMIQQLCDAKQAEMNRLQVEYETCVAQNYFIYFPPIIQMSIFDFILTMATSGATALLIGLLQFSFKKKKIKEKRSIAEKLRIVQFWKVKEIFALFFVMVWISATVFYLFMYAINNNTPEYYSKTGFAMFMQWVKPMYGCFGIYLVISYGARIPFGRFILVLAPGIMDLKHMVFETPEDLVAARRERMKRKDMLRKEVSRLRKTVDKEAADALRQETVERVTSKGSKASAGSRGRPGGTAESEPKK